jgi:UDP-N-acetylmuramoyl-L-alanyl-D-glutamate--2,6-diaminopimelate ligase
MIANQTHVQTEHKDMALLDTNPVELVVAQEFINDARCSSDHPSQQLYVIGVTGTNGKTTVAHLIGEVLKSAGHNPFVLGTLNSGNRDLSTPEAEDISRFMRDHLASGGTHFIMEVTSEGIEQGRVSDIDFDIKILTNITQDHLDYHKTFENYQRAKMSFMTFGSAHKIYPQGFQQIHIDFTTKLLGNFNYLNIQAATDALRHMDISEHHIERTLSSCLGPRGRMEIVDQGQPYMVLVDYAHTPDGLENVLKTLKNTAQTRNGRLLVLFGCGGNRDRTKRPLMGKIAGDTADLLVITDDNPRLENSREIMAEIVEGMGPEFHAYVLIQDRKTAIEFIISQCRKDDVVVLAGKGHETTQITNCGAIHFDDREQAMAAIDFRSQAENSALTWNSDCSVYLSE